jgi:ABC-type uncharacterized transport system substrate-binding protein
MASLKHKNPIPIVFGAVKDPAKIGLVNSEESSGNHITGVTGTGMPFERRIEVLLRLKPETKRLLIIYDMVITNEKCEIENILRRKNITVDAVLVDSASEVENRVIEYLNSHKKPDVIMTLRDSVVSVDFKPLIELCNRHGITLFTSHLGAVYLGAAIGIGERSELYGIESAKLVRKILEKNLHPSRIPIKRLDGDFQKLKINTETCKKQNVSLDLSSLKIKNLV